jgi:lipopolysaccharide heptosyltransferase II
VARLERDVRRIVIFCPNLIGDTVMATPALRALRKGFAGSHIAGVMKPQVAPTLDGGSWLDERILFDPRSRTPEQRSLAVIKRLRDERFDLAVLLPNSYRSAAVAWLAGVRRRIGYSRMGRGLLLTDSLAVPRDRKGQRLPVPIVGYYLAIARLLNCPIDSFRTDLFTTDADEQAADRCWSRLGLDRHETIVCLNNGGAYGPAKSWPKEHFANLARRLAEEMGVAVLVVCGPSESAGAREIVARAGHPSVVCLADEPMSIGLTKACIRRSALLVTTDSGPRHFAAPFGVPALTLFGPTHIAWTRTHDPRSVHMLNPVPCGPCQRPICPLGHHKCMRELKTDDVFEAASRMLRTRQPVMVGA